MQSHVIEQPNLDMDCSMNSDDIDMSDASADVKDVVLKEETFMVGDMELKDSIFDDVLNKKKMELMMDPEIIALFSKHQKSLKIGMKK